jgi:hypothetical protein
MGMIKRSDWGLIWNASVETGGLMLSDEVIITCEIELINSGYKDLQMILETKPDKKVVL